MKNNIGKKTFKIDWFNIRSDTFGVKMRRNIGCHTASFGAPVSSIKHKVVYLQLII